MALSRSNQFDDGTILTETKLEGEFDAIYNGGVDLISPWDDNMDANAKNLDNVATLTVQTVLNIEAASNQIVFDSDGAATGTLTWTPSSSSKTLTLPNATDTLVGKATTDTLTNKTLGTTTASGVVTFSAAPVIAVEDTRTNSTARNLTVTGTTSDTPAAGIGTGILVRAESADEDPSDFGALDFCASDVTGGSEDTYFDVFLRVAGAALTSVYRFVATGAFKAIFTHANSADRTYTLPNATTTLVGTDATQTLTNKTLGATSMDTNAALTLAEVSGTPAAGAAYSNNIISGWASVSYSGGTPSIDEDFNAASIADTALGSSTITWDRDFAGTTYAAVAGVNGGGSGWVSVSTKAAGTTLVIARNQSDNAANDYEYSVIVIGGQ